GAEGTGGDWSGAVASRCRAQLLAARAEVDAAVDPAERSVRQFEALPTPFERARSLLVLGQIRRRRKEKQPARDALAQALAIFEEVGTPDWVRGARAELSRVSGRRAGTGLTPTEETVARMAASGLTNREIAERAFLSPKTVEVNLTRVCRQLGVRSRGALSGRLVWP